MKLYKYMPCNEESMTRVENLILHGWISFSSPLKFDDLFENKISVTDKDLCIKEQHKQWIDEELARRRILCLSETNNSHVMWHYYADSCKGVCIEIEIKDSNNEEGIQLPLESFYHRASIPLRKIEYLSSEEKDNRQKALIEQNDIDSCLYLKNNEWVFEKEWRAVVKTIPDCPDFVMAKLDPASITSVYMGPFISSKAQTNILKLCHQGRFDIQTLKKSPNKSDFINLNSIPGIEQECLWRSFI